MPTPRQRDRDARAVAAIARGCGFDQAIAPLVVRQVPDVETLLRRDDATLRRVLQDATLRAPLRQAVMDGFKDVWRRAALDRIQLDHPDWLRTWWLPACADAELDRLLAAPSPRSDHRRVAISRAGFPATVGAAEVLADASHRRDLGGHLVVERRIATAVLDLAAEVAREEDRPRSTRTAVDIDQPPPGISDADAHGIGWWHG